MLSNKEAFNELAVANPTKTYKELEQNEGAK